MKELMVNNLSFIGSKKTYDEADIVLVGVPLDLTVSFIPGTRWGPSAIRTVSEVLEEYSPTLDKDLREKNYYDWGDVELPLGNVSQSLQRIEEVARKIVLDGKKPVFIGGEHLVTLPLVKVMAERHPGLAVLQFDAHADLRQEYLGQEYSHATVMWHVNQIIGRENLYQLGIRSGTREEFAYARENTRFYPEMVLEPLDDIVKNLQGRPVYVTLDIDVVDPAYAPGTSTPEPGGCTSTEILAAVKKLNELNIIGFDLVEVCPLNDPTRHTAILAAKIIREALLGWY
ncbi:agmatinase [Calderihabitans maritimus]|uniref:Putative agmatinase n=1 Tax=Calderihabitans maritimus TaxID=1246530 RepID=A0A1Z5HV18_9FIRM|nr:agmatinase [Calderihabitans maritimus]GAW93383.1 putative agmatinase [Calderihabitans maritimus]